MHSAIRRKLWTMALLAALFPALFASSAPRTVPAADINRASVAELMHVTGMTAVWAARIVRFRPYRSKLDLLDKGVLPPEVYRRIRDEIVAHRKDR